VKKIVRSIVQTVGNVGTNKIIIIGDSHAKGCAANIKQVLGNTAVVTGYVSPGSKLDNITNMAKNEINKLTKKDTVVIWG
jgi:carbonic anhydrase